MGLKKHGITSETIKNMILGAGVIYKNLKYESATVGLVHHLVQLPVVLSSTTKRSGLILRLMVQLY